MESSLHYPSVPCYAIPIAQVSPVLYHGSFCTIRILFAFFGNEYGREASRFDSHRIPVWFSLSWHHGPGGLQIGVNGAKLPDAADSQRERRRTCISAPPWHVSF